MASRFADNHDGRYRSTPRAPLLIEVVALSQRALRRVARHPNVWAVVVAQPLLITFLFRYVLGGAIGGTGMAYGQFLFPGIFVFLIVQGSGNAGIAMAEEMSSGALDRFRVLPIRRVSMLLARTLADSIKNVVTLVLVGLVAVAGSFHFATSVGATFAAMGLCLAFGIAIAWVSFGVVPV